MPIYDFLCPNCKTKKIDVFVASWEEEVKCKQCNINMKKLVSVPAMHLFPNGGIHLDHVCNGGKTFQSKKGMQEYAKEHDLELGALL